VLGVERPEPGSVPARGDRIVTGDRQLGAVTSAAFSPAVGAPIALGYVHRDFVEPGAQVQIAHDHRRLEAKVTRLPFLSPASS
jgi:aminomethyltransferase